MNKLNSTPLWILICGGLAAAQQTKFSVNDLAWMKRNTEINSTHV